MVGMTSSEAASCKLWGGGPCEEMLSLGLAMLDEVEVAHSDLSSGYGGHAGCARILHRRGAFPK